MKTKEKKPISQIFSRPLEALLAVAASGSFAAAAARLGVSPSAISQNIHELENSLGVELFDRAVKPPRLTNAGRALCGLASKQRSEMQALLEAKGEEGDLHAGLRLGVMGSLSRCVGPKLVEEAGKMTSNLSFFTTTSNDLITRLNKDQLDIVVANKPCNDRRMANLFLYSEPTILLLPRSRYAKPLTWTWDSLRFCGLPLVRYSANQGLGELTDEVFARAGVSFPEKFQVEDTILVLELIARGLGWGLTAASTYLQAPPEVSNKLEVHPVPDPDYCGSYWIIMRREDRNRMVRHVAPLLRRVIVSELLPELARRLPFVIDHVTVCDPRFLDERIPALDVLGTKRSAS